MISNGSIRVSEHVEMYVNRIDFRKITYRFMSLKVTFPIRPRAYKRNLLNLLKSSISDISTSMSTIFGVETWKIVSVYVMSSTLSKLDRIFWFLKVDDHLSLSRIFPPIIYLTEMFRLRLCKNVSAQRKFKIAMKRPTLASFNYKRSSNEQDRQSPST